MVLLSVFMSIFISLKRLIPLIHSYNRDATFVAWDTALHVGIPPWRLLQPILGYPAVTGLVSVIYGSWLFVLACCCFGQAFTDGEQRLRMQFLVTFVLCFALPGNVAATWLASGGPCFYGRLVAGEDPYEPLTHYLQLANQQVPLNWSFVAQDILWKDYASGTLEFGNGISAMPSLHVGGATLFALLGCRTNKRSGIALSAYAVVIMIGSVHLGWHYAIDGYVAILGTLAIFWMVGAVLSRFGAGRDFGSVPTKTAFIHTVHQGAIWRRRSSTHRRCVQSGQKLRSLIVAEVLLWPVGGRLPPSRNQGPG
jgi:PAP2 superfamily